MKTVESRHLLKMTKRTIMGWRASRPCTGLKILSTRAIRARRCISFNYCPSSDGSTSSDTSSDFSYGASFNDRYSSNDRYGCTLRGICLEFSEPP